MFLSKTPFTVKAPLEVLQQISSKGEKKDFMDHLESAVQEFYVKNIPAFLLNQKRSDETNE